MKKLFVAFFILIAFTMSAAAQDFEYGSSDELKGLTRIFIDTGADMKSRSLIIKEIEKARLDIKITETAGEAQIIMVYRGTSEEVVQGASAVYGTVILNKATLSSGKGLVFVEGRADKKIPRLLLSYENSQDNKLEKNPATKFAKEFVKAYKKANDIK